MPRRRARASLRRARRASVPAFIRKLRAGKKLAARDQATLFRWRGKHARKARTKTVEKQWKLTQSWYRAKRRRELRETPELVRRVRKLRAAAVRTLEREGVEDASDLVRVFGVDPNRRQYKYTVRSWIRFMSEERYAQAREATSTRRWVLGAQNDEGKLGRRFARIRV